MHTRFKDDDFPFAFEIALGSAYRGASRPGEVLATASRIKDGDANRRSGGASASAGTARSIFTRFRASA